MYLCFFLVPLYGDSNVPNLNLLITRVYMLYGGVYHEVILYPKHICKPCFFPGYQFRLRAGGGRQCAICYLPTAVKHCSEQRTEEERSPIMAAYRLPLVCYVFSYYKIYRE